MKYQYQGPGAPDIPADIVGGEIERIYREQGVINASAIVDAARDPSALLHSTFEWDDTVAAERHRESQARQLVRAVVIVPEPERGEAFQPVRAFVSIYQERQRFYKPLVRVAQEPDEREQVMRRLRNELLGVRQRYLNTLEVLGMLSAVDDLTAQLVV